jgi:hypothetical protein
MEVNERITIMCAVRYAIGRRSYAVGAVIDHLLANKHRITKEMIGNFYKDLREYEGKLPYKREWNECFEELESGI